MQSEVYRMVEIRPVSDLRNKFADISKAVHANEGGVILTKNGYPDMVVLSYEESNRQKLEREVYLKLMEAELESRTSSIRYTQEEVFAELYAMIDRRRASNGISS